MIEKLYIIIKFLNFPHFMINNEEILVKMGE